MKNIFLTTAGLLAIVGCKSVGSGSALRDDSSTNTANLIAAENEDKDDTEIYSRSRKFDDDCQAIRDAIRSAPANGTVKVYKNQSGVWTCVGPIAIERSDITVIGDASRVGTVEILNQNGNEARDLFNGSNAPKIGQRLQGVDQEKNTNGTFASPKKTDVSDKQFVIPTSEQSTGCRATMSKKEYTEQVRIKLGPLLRSPLMIIGTIHQPIDGNIAMKPYQNVVLKNFDLDGSVAASLESFMMERARKEQLDSLKKTECWGGPCDVLSKPYSSVRSSGLTMRNAMNVLVENVSTHDNSSAGFTVDKNSQKLVVKHFESYANLFDGITGTQMTGSWFDDVYLHDNMASGVLLGLNNNNAVFSRTCFEGNFDTGVYGRSSSGARFFDSYLGNNCGFGFYTAENEPKKPDVSDYVFNNVTIEKSGRGFAKSMKTGVKVDSASTQGLVFNNTRYNDNPGGGLDLLPNTFITVDGQRVPAGTPINYYRSRLPDDCRAALGYSIDGNDNCSALGGNVQMGDDTCRCNDGFPVFKFGRFNGIMVDGHRIMSCPDYINARDHDLLPKDQLQK